MGGGKGKGREGNDLGGRSGGEGSEVFFWGGVKRGEGRSRGRGGEPPLPPPSSHPTRRPLDVFFLQF